VAPAKTNQSRWRLQKRTNHGGACKNEPITVAPTKSVLGFL